MPYKQLFYETLYANHLPYWIGQSRSMNTRVDCVIAIVVTHYSTHRCCVDLNIINAKLTQYKGILKNSCDASKFAYYLS